MPKQSKSAIRQAAYRRRKALSDPSYQETEAKRKRLERSNKRTDEQSKSRENTLAAARMRRYRENKKLKSENEKRKRRGWGPLSLEQFQAKQQHDQPLVTPTPGRRRSGRHGSNDTSTGLVPTNTVDDSVSDINNNVTSDISGDLPNTTVNKLTVKMNFHTKTKAKLRAERRRNEKLQRRVWVLEKKPKAAIDSTPENPGIPERQGTPESPDTPESRESTPESQHLPQRPEFTPESQHQAQSSDTLENPETSANPESICSPIERAKLILRQDGISPTKAKTSLSALALGEGLIDTVEQFTPKKKSLFGHAILGADSIKQNRLKSAFTRRVGIDRRYGLRKGKSTLRQQRTAHFDRKSRKILEFLKRPDNSICLPGTKDCVTIEKKKHSKYILVDYVYVLYEKFIMEYPEAKVSFNYFSLQRRKSKFIKLLNHGEWIHGAKCKQHENMRLFMKAFTSGKYPPSPDEFVLKDAEELEVILNESLPDMVEYDQWDYAEDNLGKRKMKKISQPPVSKADFSSKFLQEVGTFRGHRHRVIEQHRAVKNLKDKLPPGHVTIQMDFAQNWTIKFASEIQSAFFGKPSLSIHPVVAHKRKEDGTLTCRSYVQVSDVSSHNARVVFANMRGLIPRLIEDLSPVTHVHYITDSPSSQYRNNQIFAITSRHEEMFGIPASWTYFEVGHGKGPCDGVGGASKRQAEDGVKRGESITSAKLLVDYGNKTSKSMHYMEITSDDIEECQTLLESMATQQQNVPGIMKVHGVVSRKLGELDIRETSCMSDCCFVNGQFILGCPGWQHRNVLKAVVPDQIVVPDVVPEPANRDRNIFDTMTNVLL